MEISAEARGLHQSATVVDLHADTAKLMARGYDLGRHHRSRWPLSSWAGHVDLPRMRAGGLAAEFFTCWTFPYPQRGCAREVDLQLDALEAAAAVAENGFRLVTRAEEIRRGRADGFCLGLRGIEGGQALEGKIENLEHFAARGVRYLGPLHFTANGLGFSSLNRRGADPRGLTPWGCEVVDACARLGVMVDLAHLNRAGFFAALARLHACHRPALVSHTGCAAVHPHWRNLDNQQLRAVADGGGVVGIIFAAHFLGGELPAVVEHILHAVRVAGDQSVALGSDWDGFIRPARGLGDPTGLPRLTEALLRRGLPPPSILRLLGGNVLRLLEDVPPAPAP